MTNSPAAATFAYDALAAEDAAAVRRSTDRLRAALASTARLVVTIGLHLARVRRRLKPYRGAWQAYVRAELPWSRGQVYRLLRAAKAFRRVAEVDRYQPTALYVLTWPDAPPAAAREALRLAREGETIDARTARRLVAAHRPTPPATVADTEPADPIPEADPGAELPVADGPQWWGLVEECGRRFSSLHISWDEDGEAVGVTGYPREEGAALVSQRRGHLPAALAALLDPVEKLKVCQTCKAKLPPGKFCRHKGEPDGLNPYCRDCARAFRETAKAKKGPRARRPRQRPLV